MRDDRVQQMMVVVPVDGEIDEAQHVDHEVRRHAHERGPAGAVRDLQLQHHDGDDDRQDAVAEGRQPLFSHAVLVRLDWSSPKSISGRASAHGSAARGGRPSSLSPGMALLCVPWTRFSSRSPASWAPPASSSPPPARTASRAPASTAPALSCSSTRSRSWAACCFVRQGVILRPLGLVVLWGFVLGAAPVCRRRRRARLSRRPAVSLRRADRRSCHDRELAGARRRRTPGLARIDLFRRTMTAAKRAAPT